MVTYCLCLTVCFQGQHMKLLHKRFIKLLKTINDLASQSWPVPTSPFVTMLVIVPLFRACSLRFQKNLPNHQNSLQLVLDLSLLYSISVCMCQLIVWLAYGGIKMQLQFKETKELLAKEREATQKASEVAPIIQEVPVIDHEVINTSQNENSAPEDVQMTEESSCEPDPSEVIYSERLTKIKGILSGETTIQLTLQFLYSHNKSDLLILKTIKQSVEMRNSVCHSATIYANSIMHAGTTVDTFLRENLVKLIRATNWAKFSATAGLGVIHRGHLQQGRSLMVPYLPQGAAGGGGSPYSEGGALYALGLIHANHGEGIKQFLRDSLRSTNVEVIHHGACLGLGLAALGTADEEIYEDIKTVLYTDSCCWGLALGIALTVYGREEEADTLIEQMTRDQDPILRYGGMYALALAYSGTANNKAIRQLLHFAVSDVSDDVRRTAVLALGFVLYSEPEQTPRIVSLLSESYNPHVRYGAALAVGISCAGTRLSEAISLLEPLTSDVVDFVRQGALIAMAMVMVQTSTYPTGHGPNLIMAGLKHLYDLVLVFYLNMWIFLAYLIFLVFSGFCYLFRTIYFNFMHIHVYLSMFEVLLNVLFQGVRHKLAYTLGKDDCKHRCLFYSICNENVCNG
ncbi:hypothetical protein UlMin_045294 [Ulmus minor]